MTTGAKDKSMHRVEGMINGQTTGRNPRKSWFLQTGKAWSAGLILSVILVFGSIQTVMAGGGAINNQYRQVMAGKQEALAAALDPSTGEVVITGYTNGSDIDYYTIKVKADFTGVLWTASPGDFLSDGSGADRSKAVVIDMEGNVIITGYVDNGSNVDILTIKYNGATGAIIWEKLYNGDFGGDDYPTAIAIDNLDNVYVAGYSPGDTAEGGSGDDDYILIKYSSGGIEQWVERVNGSGDKEDHPLAVATSSDPDLVAITGHTSISNGVDTDYLTVVYDLDGTEQWRKDNPDTNGIDEAVKVAFDSNGDVIVTGYVTNGTGDFDILTIKYDGSNGDVIHAIPYAGADGGADKAADLFIDTASDDDIYIAGYSFTNNGFDDFYLARYDTDTGTKVWDAFYPDPGAPASMDTDVPMSMVVNDTSVIVTGRTFYDATSHDDFQTAKFTKDLGHLLWNVPFDFAGANKSDEAIFVGLDNTGKLYVAGWVDTAADDWDFYAIEYDPGALATPTDLTAVAVSETEIALSWTDNPSTPNEEEYEIWRRVGTEGSYELIDTEPANTTSYNDVDQGIGAGLGLEPHKRYYYMVRGHNATAEEYSHYSNEAYALTTIVTPNNNPEWVFTYNGSRKDAGDPLKDSSVDEATAIGVGPDQDPVVTGIAANTGSAVKDYYTAKLQRQLDAGNVVTIWDDTYDGGYGDDFAYCLTVDNNNDVVISGQSRLFSDDISGDILTRKYDGSNGPPAFGDPYIWQHQYDGFGGEDDAVAIDSAISATNDIVVVGHGDDDPVTPDQEIEILKFDVDANGNNTYGATKIYKRACFEKISPIDQIKSWDFLDNIKAKSQGFETQIIASQKVIHLKPMDSISGKRKENFLKGYSDAHLQYRKVFVLLKFSRLLIEKPFIIGGLAYAHGYLKNILLDRLFYDDERIVELIHAQQSTRLKDLINFS